MKTNLESQNCPHLQIFMKSWKGNGLQQVTSSTLIPKCSTDHVRMYNTLHGKLCCLDLTECKCDCIDYRY